MGIRRVVILFSLGVFSYNAAPVSAHDLLDRAGVKGGLVVHIGSDQARLLVELSRYPGYILQGLATNPTQVARTQAHLLSQGVYGRVSVHLFSGQMLPYAENLVNLLVIDDVQIRLPRQEILRVLVPNGVALVHGQRLQKPRPTDIDEWSHFEHGPENNAVAADTVVGPPRHLQWAAGPRWLRTHEEPSGITSMVTAGGRLFYTLDEGPIGISDARLPEKWALIARDAFNGTLLWKVPLPHWGWQTWKSEFKQTFKGLDWIKTSGLRTKNPPSYVHRMVADEERLYFTLGHEAAVSIIDAATGKVTATCAGSDNPQKLLLCHGVLCVQLAQAVVAYEAASGRELWKRQVPHIAAMAAHDRWLVYHANDRDLHALDLNSGRELWQSPLDTPGALKIAAGKVLSVTEGAMQVFSLDTGQSLWCNPPQGSGKVRSTGERGYYIIDDTLWLGYEGQRVDFLTGQRLPSLEVENLWSPQHHHRCYPNKATTRYIIGAMEGMEFLCLRDRDHSRNNWVRGSCGLGIVPANGMTYVPPDQCFCSPGVKLLGLNALCAAKSFPPPASVENRLQQGPAYGQALADDDGRPWPAYRHDALRSGATTAQVPDQVRRSWEVALDPSITQPVVSAHGVFIASRDTHTIYALDGQSGRQRWRFTAGARIDSPPTLWKGLLLFGCADGYVYCLRQTDGVLVWRFRAAPHLRLIQSFGQIESAWPLHGSVLMLDDLAYVSAGRSTYLDGGLYLYALEPATGKVVYQHQELGPYEDHTQGVGHSFWSEGARNDVLVSDGESIYVMQLRFDKQLRPVPAQPQSLLGDRTFGRHIFSTAGFLDDAWYNRAFWMHSTIWPGFYLANQASKSGQLLVFNATTTFGVKVFWTRNRHTPMFFPGTKGYLLFADDNDSEPMLVGRDRGTPLTWLPAFNMDKGKTRKTTWGPDLSAAPQDSSVDAYTYNKDKGIGFTRTQKPLWSVYVPIRIKAMVGTRDTLFVAGAPDVFDEQDDPLGALEDRKGGVLRAVSTADGATLGEYALQAPPVLDGLIAVQGKLLLATCDGRLSCWQ